MAVTIYQGDCREILAKLAEESIHAVVTSPPYFGLRDYGVRGQIGIETDPDHYVRELVKVFRQVHRVLRKDGTFWLNVGDSYNSNPAGAHPGGFQGKQIRQNVEYDLARSRHVPHSRAPGLGKSKTTTAKPKDLLLIPHRLGLALQQDGWWVRSDIIWQKTSPLPESVRDRPTQAHEHLFMLAKSTRYYFDHEAVREPSRQNEEVGRNVRNVWTIPSRPHRGIHFAVMPPDLIDPCLRAGTSRGGVCEICSTPLERCLDHTPVSQTTGLFTLPVDGPVVSWVPRCHHHGGAQKPPVVMDPFFGSGTTGLVAHRLGCDAIGVELNPRYVDMAVNRLLEAGVPVEVERI